MGHDTTRSHNDYFFAILHLIFSPNCVIFFYCLMECAVEKQVTVKILF